MVEGATIVVPLPAGKLGLSFVGKDGDVIVADVKESGAMYGRPIKPGYIVTSIMIGDQEENFTDKKSLVGIISANSEETNRKLKCKIAYKSEIEVTVPSYDGFTVSTRKGLPCISKIDASCSTLKAKASVGMIVNKVSIGGYAMAGHDSDAINALLEETQGEAVTLTLLAPKSELSSKSIKFESTKVAELPTGAATGGSLKIIGENVPEVDVGSTVSGILPGMAIQAIRIPNGCQYDDLDAEQLVKVLEETDDIEGRLVNLVPNDYIQSAPTLKVYPPTLGGSMEELGFHCESSGAGGLEIASVEDYSDLAGLSAGLALKEVVYEDADDTTRTVIPTTVEMLEKVLSKSSGCDRHLVFELPSSSGRGKQQEQYPDTGICGPIPLEPGKLGMTFKGTPAVLIKVKETSQILGKGYDVKTGMVVTECIIDGQVMTNPGTTELTAALVASATSNDRVITFSM